MHTFCRSWKNLRAPARGYLVRENCNGGRNACVQFGFDTRLHICIAAIDLAEDREGEKDCRREQNTTEFLSRAQQEVAQVLQQYEKGKAKWREEGSLWLLSESQSLEEAIRCVRRKAEWKIKSSSGLQLPKA